MRVLLLVMLLTLVAWGQPVRIGLLHSQTGPYAVKEKSLLDAALLAIEEINAHGGVLGGRKIEAIVVDGRSDPRHFAEGARQLCEQGVCALFGTWTSDSRRAVLPVLKEFDQVLFYGVNSEGMEESPFVIYSGVVPNQQLFPALDWMAQNVGERAWLVGSDSFFTRTMHALARLALHGKELGETLRPMGPGDYTEVVRAIAAAKPDYVLLTQDRLASEDFFTAWRKAGLKQPVLSLTLGEVELAQMKEKPAGQYVCRGYFSSLDVPENRRFLAHWHKRFGPDAPVDDDMQTAWFQVRAFATALRKAGSTEPRKIREAARGVILDTPGGLVRIDPRNQHAWRTCRLGQILPDGRIEVRWSSEVPVKPEPMLGGSSRGRSE